MGQVPGTRASTYVAYSFLTTHAIDTGAATLGSYEDLNSNGHSLNYKQMFNSKRYRLPELSFQNEQNTVQSVSTL